MAGKRGNGEGTISRRKDGRWEGRYHLDTPEGRKRRVVYGKTRKEAAERLARAVSEKDKPQRVVTKDVAFHEFLKQYENVAKLTMKRRSFETYEDIAKLHLLPTFGEMYVRNLRREHVQRLYSEKVDSGLSAARVRRIHGVLSSILAHAVRWGEVEHNVCMEVSPPRVPAPEIRPFDAEEARRFLEVARGDRYYPLYVLGISTGMRSGELGGLFWSDLDLCSRTVRVQRSLITGKRGQTFEAPKTTTSRRTIGLTRLAVGAIEAHRESQRREGVSVDGGSIVFTNTIGGPMNPSHLFCRSFKPILKKAGLPKTTFHAATRHTFCCLALRQGVNAKSVSLAMGHSSVAFTLQKYASFIPNYGDTANGLDDALEGQEESRTSERRASRRPAFMPIPQFARRTAVFQGFASPCFFSFRPVPAPARRPRPTGQRRRGSPRPTPSRPRAARRGSRLE